MQFLHLQLLKSSDPHLKCQKTLGRPQPPVLGPVNSRRIFQFINCLQLVPFHTLLQNTPHPPCSWYHSIPYYKAARCPPTVNSVCLTNVSMITKVSDKISKEEQTFSEQSPHSNRGRRISHGRSVSVQRNTATQTNNLWLHDRPRLWKLSQNCVNRRNKATRNVFKSQPFLWNKQHTFFRYQYKNNINNNTNNHIFMG